MIIFIIFGSGSGVLLLVMAIVLMLGKGQGLIAGFNTMAAAEKAKYDAPALCRFIGKCLLVIAIMTILLPIPFLLNLEWLMIVYLAIVLGLSFFMVIYCNTGQRFLKK